MLIRNVTRTQLNDALDDANMQFANNLLFKRRDSAGLTRQGTGKYIITLTVRNSRAPGARRSPNHWRAISAACWHAHRAFLDALPPGAEVVSSPPTRNATKPYVWHPGDEHHDWNVGSQMYPCQASEACDC